MARAPTLKDVAKAAGVSEMTASRAMRDAADVSKATRKKITEAAISLGYVPNRIAGSLASRSVNLVGVVVPSLKSFVFPEVLSGVSTGLKGSSLQPVIGVSDYDLKKEEDVIREMLSWRPRGLIVAGLEHSDNARKMLEAADVPIVEIMDTDGPAVDFCVGISHHEAGQLMAGEILSRGYRKIGFIGTKMPHDFRAQKRLQGFKNLLNTQGKSLTAERLYDESSSIAQGRNLTAEMLAAHPEIDCIYYSSDVMSIGGLMHCLANNLSVPRDVALAGFNGLDQLDGLPLQLATCNAFRYEIGQKAADIILHETFGKPDETEIRSKIARFTPIVEPGGSI